MHDTQYLRVHSEGKGAELCVETVAAQMRKSPSLGMSIEPLSDISPLVMTGGGNAKLVLPGGGKNG
jgi:ABC-type Zn2+ transport system substrate-binding protein/surface adhesin